ncbi:MAG: hypothetical protein QOK42_1630 [Frankiaceae bacterium]|nr:hypothetical protein [Frankiaceae bacterium]
MGRYPSGYVTFMFTDIEGSTRLHHDLGAGYPALLDRHDRLVTAAIEQFRGVTVNSMGDGVFAAFQEAADAVDAAAEIQRRVAAEAWPGSVELRVRIGLHAGPAEPRGRAYVALAVHQASRVASAAHGGQVLATTSVVDGVKGPTSGAWRELGAFRLKDFDDAAHLWQLDVAGVASSDGFVRAAPDVPHNVPDVRTSFVGRDHDLHQLQELITAGQRVVSLVGPGGVGKTRLGFELTKRMSSAFTHGAWVVLLANERERDIALRVLQVLNVPERGDVAPRETLRRALQARQTMLLVDNCEHLIDQVAELVDDLIRECPDLVVVTTTREALRVADEYEWRVDPLPVEPGVRAPGSAVRLFIERATSRRRDLQFTPSEVDVITGICRELDGLPLAIELAAGRLRHMSVNDLAAALSETLGTLALGERTLDRRQRTMDDLVRWSHDLVSEPARQLLHHMSIFRGATSLEAVRAVVESADGIDQALAELVDKSLVTFDRDAPRPYRLLVVIRDFAERQIAGTAAEPAARRRHAEWHRALAERLWAAGRDRSRIRSTLAATDALHDDFAAAMGYAAEAEAGDLLAHIALALNPYFVMRGRLDEGRRWLEGAAAATDDPLLSARALSGAGRLAQWQGDVDMPRRAFEIHLVEARRAENRLEQTVAHLRLGELRAFAGELDVADKHFMTAERFAREDVTLPPGNSWWLIEALNGHGIVAYFRGDLGTAESFYRQALEVANSVNAICVAIHLNLAEVLLARGKHDEAEALFIDQLEDVREFARFSLPGVYSYLARLCQELGRGSEATAWRDWAVAAARELGDHALAQQLAVPASGTTVSGVHADPADVLSDLQVPPR